MSNPSPLSLFTFSPFTFCGVAVTVWAGAAGDNDNNFLEDILPSTY